MVLVLQTVSPPPVGSLHCREYHESTVSWWCGYFSDRWLQTGRPSRYTTNTKVNLVFHSFGVGKSSLSGTSSSGARSSVSGNTVYDSIWQVTLCSSVMSFLLSAIHKIHRLYLAVYLFVDCWSRFSGCDDFVVKTAQQAVIIIVIVVSSSSSISGGPWRIK